jgi:GH15 family glucan-1,4-alpha-glucosidase
MASKIEHYAMIGDCRTAALVGLDGSIDWLCVPRFDSGACFAALLGSPENGRWKLGPAKDEDIRHVRRRYRPGSLVLETEFATGSGTVRLTDAMAIDSATPSLIRTIESLRGEVLIRSELAIRFDYGWVVPWVRHLDDTIYAIAGPNAMQFDSDVPTRGEDFKTLAEFTLAQGQRTSFSLTWHASHEPPPPRRDAFEAIKKADEWWQEWSGRCQHAWARKDDDAGLRSLITLKALTFAPTGGIVAAVTTSLPEWLGGPRNWDYRYCWLRDATFSLIAMMEGGYLDEARSWRDWLLRAVAGKPEHLQIMYGLGGERRLSEQELPWLAGYEGSKPVRVGNAASEQFQLDVFGEMADVLHQARQNGLAPLPLHDAWAMQETILNYLESAWSQPDEGIWEVRGGRRPFTHSKVMAWVAFDRAVKAVEQWGKTTRDPGSPDRWRAARKEIFTQVCEKGFDQEKNAFIQSFGSKELDASLLMIPLVGFLPPNDPRVVGTVEAIRKELMDRGFVKRYDTGSHVDGLPPGEGVFLPCTFWLADNLAMMGRTGEAREIYDRLLGLRNDVGLLAEEYDPDRGRLLGNFPQAFTHVCLVNTARDLYRDKPGPRAC